MRVTRGVLQGEILSPILFALFLSDIETFLRERGCRGVSIDSSSEILLLAYADDIVILSNTRLELRRQLNALNSYCEINKLQINTSKTQIVPFREGYRKKKKKRMTMKLNPLLYSLARSWYITHTNTIIWAYYLLTQANIVKTPQKH